MAAELLMAEGAAPSTPASGKAIIFIDTSGNLCKIDDAGNVMKLASAGSFTITFPASGTVALLGTAQTFTAMQTIAPATDVVALDINLPAGAASNAMRIFLNSVQTISFISTASDASILLTNRNQGNDVTGPFFRNGRNTSAGAVGPAAGTNRYVSAGGTTYSTWVDATGDLRINTSAPTGSSGAPTVSDTAGTVVGDQTSWHELKQNIIEHLTRDDLLDAVLNLRLYDFEMWNEHHTGLVIYEDDRDAWFAENAGPQQVPALNERSLFGYLIGAIQAQQAQIAALTQRITALEAKA